MSPIALPLVASGRTCGECTACCTAISVYEFRKKSGVRCENECGSGCGIYASRPQSCRDYSCLWLSGFIEGDERRRPDQLGLVFDTSPIKTGGQLVWAHETRPGASREPAAQYLLGRLEKRFPVLVRRTDGTGVLQGETIPADQIPLQENMWDTPAWESFCRGEFSATAN